MYIFTGRRPMVVDGKMRKHGDRLPESLKDVRHLPSLMERGIISYYPDPPKTGSRQKAASKPVPME